MKKYLFSFLAIAVAVASVAFTTSDNSRVTTDVYFEYNSSNFDDDDVELPANWIESASDFETGCSPAEIRPCKIKVDVLDTDQGTPGSRQLLSIDSVDL
jgi:hypothetical protein